MSSSFIRHDFEEEEYARRLGLISAPCPVRPDPRGIRNARHVDVKDFPEPDSLTLGSPP
jgi:hypothetical protein